MRVRCKFCQFEDGGTCSKKSSRVKINKPRTCSLYKEDSFRVFQQYKKEEKHKIKLRKMALQRAKINNLQKVAGEK